MQRAFNNQASRAGRKALALIGALALIVAVTGTAYASDNPIADKEWALNRLQNEQIHSRLGAHGSGVIIADVDSGVDPGQPDLSGSLVTGLNLINPNNPTSDTTDTTSESHGTAIATIMASHAHEVSGIETGMISLADEAKVMPVKISDTTDSVNLSALGAGIRYAADHGARVISTSFGQDGTCTQQMIDDVDYALARNAVVIVAAGNTALSGNADDCPGSVPGVIDVASIAQDGQMDQYSYYGRDISVAAPGVDIEVGLTGEKYGQASGTSVAAPWVAAEAALIIGLHPTWTQGQVVAAIIDNTAQSATGQSQHGKRYDDHVGYGVIDPLAALGAAEPASTANPLGGPAVTSSAAASAGATGGSTATTGGSGGNGGQTPAAGGAKKSSSAGIIAGVVIVVVVVGGLVLFFVTRNRRGGGSGGPGGGGGGGNNGYYPPTPPGGQHAQPPQGYQQPNPYQQQLPQQQGIYQPQPGGGGYGQSQQRGTGGYGQAQPGGGGSGQQYGHGQQQPGGGYGQAQPGGGESGQQYGQAQPGGGYGQRQQGGYGQQQPGAYGQGRQPGNPYQAG